MTKKYIVPADLVERLEQIPLSLNAMKLVHSLICHAHQAVDGHTPLLWQGMRSNRLVRASYIKEEFGWASQKSNRPLQAAIDDPQLGQVLSQCSITATGRGLHREFSKRIIEAATVKNFDPDKRKDKYALLDAKCIAECRSSEAIVMYTRCAMHRRQDFPVFSIPGVGNGEAKKRAVNTRTPLPTPMNSSVPWGKVREKWLRAASNVAEMSNDTILFRIEEGLLEPGVAKVSVVLVNSTTRWRSQDLYKLRGGVRYIEISRDRRRSLTKDEVRRRAQGRRQLEDLQRS